MFAPGIPAARKIANPIQTYHYPMSFIGDIFGIAPLVVCFGLLSTWAYRFAFNHHLITSYSNPHAIGKNHINTYIDRTANSQYGCNLQRLDVDDEYVAASTSNPRRSLADTHEANIHRVVGVLFAVTTALSVELVGVLLVQLLGLVEVHVLFFRPALRILVVLVTVVVPLLVVSLYVNQDLVPLAHARMSHMAATVVLYGAWYVLLHKMGDVAGALGESGAKSFVERKTNEIVITGITITAVLLGVGSILTPFGSFWGDNALLRRHAAPLVSELLLNRLISQYNSTKMLMRKREAELSAAENRVAGKVYNGPEKGYGASAARSLRGSGKHLFHKVLSFALLSAFAAPAEEDELRSEIASLGALKEQIYGDVARQLHRLVAAKRNRRQSRWSVRRVAAMINMAFAVYCVYRVANVLLVRLPYHYWWAAEDIHEAALNIIDDKQVLSEQLNKNTKDALAITVAKILLTAGLLALSETQLINQVSFMLSGSLFLCSFQNVAVTFKSVAGLLPTPTTTVLAKVKAWLQSLVVCELVAVYVIATALLIRSNLPPETASHLLELLLLSPAGATVRGMQHEVEFIDTWFDKVFGVTCVVAAVVLALKLFIESGNVYDDGYDEENFIEDGLKRT